MEESEDPIAEGNGLLLIIKNKTNKNNPIGEKNRLAGWTRLDRAGQGRAGQGRAGQGRAGQGRAGQGRAGQGRAGKGRAGQGRAGQGRAQDIDNPTYGNEPTRNCKHKEILKGANEEGNEGKQLGKINQ